MSKLSESTEDTIIQSAMYVTICLWFNVSLKTVILCTRINFLFTVHEQCTQKGNRDDARDLPQTTRVHNNSVAQCCKSLAILCTNTLNMTALSVGITTYHSLRWWSAPSPSPQYKVNKQPPHDHLDNQLSKQQQVELEPTVTKPR